MLGEERIIRLSDPKERQAVADFLAKFDLTFTEEVDYTFALYREEQIIGTGSLSGKVLRNVAIDPNLQGEGLMAKVISHLMAEGARRGGRGEAAVLRCGDAGEGPALSVLPADGLRPGNGQPAGRPFPVHSRAPARLIALPGPALRTMAR